MDLIEKWKERARYMRRLSSNPVASQHTAVHYAAAASTLLECVQQLEDALALAPKYVTAVNVQKLLTAAKMALVDQIERTCMDDELYDALVEAIEPLDANQTGSFQPVGTWGSGEQTVYKLTVLGIPVYIASGHGGTPWLLKGDKLGIWLKEQED
jgi:hypothetical protein